MDSAAQMLTLAAFLLTLAILITVHEYGHYQVARWCGVKILCFSIGFGKPLYRRCFGPDQTEFIVAALPLGGYVKMLDEREAPVKDSADLTRAFNRQSVWKRIAIVAAGPMANLLLAILLYWVLLMSGMPGLRPLLGEVTANSSAAQAGMQTEDLIVRIGNTAVSTWQDVRWAILQESLQSHSLEVEVKNKQGQALIRQLDVSKIKPDEAEIDILDSLGLTLFRPVLPARIGEIVAGSAAERDGLQANDQIISVNGVNISHWEAFAALVQKNPGKILKVEIRRHGIVMHLNVTPDSMEKNGMKIGRVGAAYLMSPAETDRLMTEVKYAPASALWHASAQTWDTSIFSLKMLGGMLTGAVSWKSMGGPITIGSAAGKSASAGWKVFLGFLALISISLGVLNLLPVPVLDGGHLMYYVVEIFKGDPVSEAAMEIGQRIGFALLGLLMVSAFYNDINRLILG